MRLVVSFALGALIAASSAAEGENLLQRLTDTGARNGQAHFSPDGRRISFVSNREGSWQVYVMSADGSAARRLTEELEPAGWPSWSPEAAWIYYYARREGRYALMRIPSEGGEAQVGAGNRHQGRDVHALARHHTSATAQYSVSSRPYLWPNRRRFPGNGRRGAKS